MTVKVPKRFLLLAAGFAWTIAGAMLVGRAEAWLLRYGDHLLLRSAVALVGGVGFFFLMFKKVSLRHASRIRAMAARPSLFSFFDGKSYVMMALMIAGGVSLRVFKLVEPSLLYTFYACMGTPLLISAFGFYRMFAEDSRIDEA